MGDTVWWTLSATVTWPGSIRLGDSYTILLLGLLLELWMWSLS